MNDIAIATGPQGSSRHAEGTTRLADGTEVLIRPLRPDDTANEREFIESLSPESRRFRFLGQISHPDERLLSLLTNVDQNTDAAFAAVLAGDPDGRFIGVARFDVADDKTRCECAITVRDEWHHHGLGTLLMTHLIDTARSRGIRYMTSIDSASNTAMTDLARDLGFSQRTDPDEPSQVIHTLAIAPRPT